MKSGRHPGDPRPRPTEPEENRTAERRRWLRVAGAIALAAGMAGLTSQLAGPPTTAAADVYWVQVGAFRDPQAAQRLAQKLREQKFPVQESGGQPTSGDRAPSRSAAAPGDERDRYEVLVTGGAPGEIEAKLSSKGLTSRAAADGAAITPSLPLGEAVALSKDLSGEGLAVRVRRADPMAPSAPRARPDPASSALYRVRVGGFPNRAAAEAAMDALRSRGYAPVLTRETE